MLTCGSPARYNAYTIGAPSESGIRESSVAEAYPSQETKLPAFGVTFVDGCACWRNCTRV
eukprot:scaffold251371_cov23-Tisochrysis_lutea.AAC.1